MVTDMTSDLVSCVDGMYPSLLDSARSILLLITSLYMCVEYWL